MNQQTRYPLKVSMLDYKKNNQTLSSKEHVLPVMKFQDIPDIVELVRIMLGIVHVENARKMTMKERHAFYNSTNALLILTHKLS